MADATDLDLGAGAPKKKSGTLKLVMVVLILTIVLGAAGGGAILFLLGDKSDQTDAVPRPAPLIYMELDPPLIGNLEGGGRVRFVQVGLVIGTRDRKVVDTITQHMPVVRNDLLLLLSSKTFADLVSAEGKEATRLEMLKAIRNVVQLHSGQPGVESIYFTSFVMQ